MSEEVALAAADLATVEQLRARVLEWEDCYDRLLGAFDLHMAICECQNALSDYVGGYYDVVLGALGVELEAARAVVHAATLLGTGPDSVTWTAMYAAIEAYDAVVKKSGT
jgi:hypothetical protein